MSTTYTDSLRAALQGFNDSSNTWGTVLNSQFTLFDKAIAGVTPLDVTGSVTIDMTTSATDGSDSLSKRAILKITGIPTANTSITVPAVTKAYIVHSSLQANKNVFIHPTGSNVGVTVGQSDAALIYCDGTDMILITRNFDSSTILLKADNLASLANTSAALVNLGITASASELNALDGITASVTELNVLDGITASVAELNFIDGVTSNVQTQISNLTSITTSLSSIITSVATIVAATNGAKAWANFSANGGTVSVGKSYNVSSVTRNSIGNFTINFTTAMTDANYCIPIVPQLGTFNTPLTPWIVTRTVSTCNFTTYSAGDNSPHDPIQCNLVVFD